MAKRRKTESVAGQQPAPDSPRRWSADPVQDFQLSRSGLLRALAYLTRDQDALPPTPVPASQGLDLPADLPMTGIGPDAALAAVAPSALAGAARLDHPGFFAHMDPPTPWMSWAAEMWAAARNQNLLHPETSPAAETIERTVIRWMGRAFGMDGGQVVPGSTLANMTALWAAREATEACQVVASTSAHVSVRKAADLLGLRYVEVPVDDAHRMRADLLPDLSRSVLVLTAGTTATGAVDRLTAGTDAAWRHIDAAWAGPLYLSERYAERLEGMTTADSISISAHKWLFQPKESALILFADPERATERLRYGGSYLTQPNIGLLGSHGATALPLLVSLLAWGREGVAELINHCMAVAERLAELVDQEPALEVWGEPMSGIVVWRPRTVRAMTVRHALTGAFVSLVNVDDDTWFRSVAANPFADPGLVVARVLEAVAEASQS